MPYIRIIDEEEATGQLAEDYDYLSKSYSRLVGGHMKTPNVYRTSSVVDAYFRFGALQNRVLTDNGKHTPNDGPLPKILVNFAVALNSSCFY